MTCTLYVSTVGIKELEFVEIGVGELVTSPPTTEDWRDDLLESVQSELDDSYRHGNYVYEVFHRPTDDTYWAVNYSVSGDGEQHGLRDDEHDGFTRVYPHKKVVAVVEYSTEP